MRPALKVKKPLLGPDDLPVDHLVTEDDTPVDNVYSERQQRLLVAPLYASWQSPGKRPFLALANVGLFYSPDAAPVVPDFMLSLDTKLAKPGKSPLRKRNRSYFTWVYGKVPEVSIEVVSNRKGGEEDEKLELYAQLGIIYYAIHDPYHRLSEETLRLFRLSSKKYLPMKTRWLAKAELGLTLWHGEFEGMTAEWLRWCDQDGRVIPTGAERADQEKQRADLLAEKLRQMGMDPDAS